MRDLNLTVCEQSAMLKVSPWPARYKTQHSPLRRLSFSQASQNSNQICQCGQQVPLTGIQCTVYPISTCTNIKVCDCKNTMPFLFGVQFVSVKCACCKDACQHSALVKQNEHAAQNTKRFNVHKLNLPYLSSPPSPGMSHPM